MTAGRYQIGVDVGGTNTKLAVLDTAGEIVAKTLIPTHAHEGHDRVLERIVTAIKEIAGQVSDDEVGSVGIGVPGEVYMETGHVRDLPNLPGRWSDVPVTATIEAATGYPAYLINDVRAFTVAESEIGAAKGADTALFLAVGTGIGGGVVAHGQTLFGLGGAAGEIGHIIVVANGARCGCGNRGCVETLASGPAIIAEANRRIAQGFTTSLHDLCGGDLSKMTPEIVVQAAAAGDKNALEVLEQAGYYLGLAVAGAIALVAPEVVVIGGGVAQPGGIYWRTCEATARAHSHVTEIEQIAFRPPVFGYDAGVIGAARWGGKQVGRR
ncbi:MAG: ROK family protein [Thermomicrobiales bacterium]